MKFLQSILRSIRVGSAVRTEKRQNATNTIDGWLGSNCPQHQPSPTAPRQFAPRSEMPTPGGRWSRASWIVVDSWGPSDPSHPIHVGSAVRTKTGPATIDGWQFRNTFVGYLISVALDRFSVRTADPTRLIVAFLAVAFAAFSYQPLPAAVIYLKGESEPLAGFVETSDEVSIDLRIERPGAEPQRRRILRSAIDVLLQPVNPQRLAQLSPDNPAAYREYAEELVEKRADPEAVETALRLFVIAAHLDPAGQARGALLGMTPLAEDQRQVRAWRALAYLQGETHDARLLQPASGMAHRQSSLTPELRKELLKLLGYLRRGQRNEARQLLQREDLQAGLRTATSALSVAECQELVAGTCPGCQGGDVPTYLLQKLLAAELALTSAQTDRPAPAQWSFFLAPEFLRPLPVLSLENATPFDPRKSVYRNGQWVEP